MFFSLSMILLRLYTIFEKIVNITYIPKAISIYSFQLFYTIKKKLYHTLREEILAGIYFGGRPNNEFVLRELNEFIG